MKQVKRVFVVFPQWCSDIKKRRCGWLYREKNTGPTDQEYFYYRYDPNAWTYFFRSPKF